MTPEQACKFQLPFGKYNGKTLDEIVTKDPKGAEYLDWLVGQHIQLEVKIALKTFLAIPWVAELVDRATEKHTSRTTSEPIENLKKPKAWWEK